MSKFKDLIYSCTDGVRLHASRSSRKKPKPTPNSRISKIRATRLLTDHQRRLSRASARPWRLERPLARRSSSLLLMEIGMATRMVVARAGYLVTTIDEGDEGFSARVGGKVRRFQCINSFKRQGRRMDRCQPRIGVQEEDGVLESECSQEGHFRQDENLELTR